MKTIRRWCECSLKKKAEPIIWLFVEWMNEQHSLCAALLLVSRRVFNDDLLLHDARRLEIKIEQQQQQQATRGAGGWWWQAAVDEEGQVVSTVGGTKAKDSEMLMTSFRQ